MTVGANGYACAHLFPGLAASNGTVTIGFTYPVTSTVTMSPLITSLSSYAQTDFTIFNPATGILRTGLQAHASDSPYNNSDYYTVINGEMYNTHEVRLVAAGLKVQYRGTELNRAGDIILYRNPSNNSEPIATTSGLLASHHCTRAPVDRKWHSVTYRPTKPEQYSYHPFEYAYNEGGVSSTHATAFPMDACVIGVSGAVAGESFIVEADMYFEVVGPRRTLTHTPSDPVGMSAVVSSNTTIQNTRQPEHEEKAMAKAMTDHVKNSLTIPNVMQAVSTGVQVAKAVPAALSAIEEIGETLAPLALTLL